MEAFIEFLESRRLMAVVYNVQAASSPVNTWTTGWSNRFALSSGYTGSDGVYSIPMNGNDKLGSAYNTAGWQTFTFNDTFIGSYNTTTGLRNAGTKFINNTTGMVNTSGATPAAISYKWRTDQTIQERMAMITRPSNTSPVYYWPNDGVVIDNAGTKQMVQFSLKMQSGGGLNTQGVAVTSWDLPATPNYTTNWPYKNAHNTDWRNSDVLFGQVPNVFKAQSGTWTGPRTAGAAILDRSNTTTAYTADGFIYIYAVQNGPDLFEKDVFVARATPANLVNTSTWEYWSGDFSGGNDGWNGSGFGQNAIDYAQPLKDTNNVALKDMASEFSVIQLPDQRFAMVYSQNDMFGGGKIAVRYASNPTGPWTTPTIVHTVSTPNSGNASLNLRAMPAPYNTQGWTYGVYGAKVHPQLSKAPTGTGTANAGRLLVSFHILPIDSSPGELGPEFQYGDIYRPRFVELSLVGVNTLKALPAPRADFMTALGGIQATTALPRAERPRNVDGLFEQRALLE